jgi:molecular chaperone DnaJ
MERLDEVDFELPAGIEDGTQIRISGRGEGGSRGGGSGDLYVQINVAPDPKYRRSRDDLILAMSIPFSQATLGGIVTIETFDGPIELRVPPGTQPGEIVKLRNHGVPHFQRPGRGDLLVEIAIEVPKDLTPAQEELVRRLASERGEQVAESSGLFDKIRDAFRS